MDELEARIAELREQEELARIRPALDGDAGDGSSSAFRPAAIVGEALDFLLEIRLEEGEIHRGRGARARCAAWARDRGIEPRRGRVAGVRTPSLRARQTTEVGDRGPGIGGAHRLGLEEHSTR